MGRSAHTITLLKTQSINLINLSDFEAHSLAVSIGQSIQILSAQLWDNYRTHSQKSIASLILMILNIIKILKIAIICGALYPFLNYKKSIRRCLDFSLKGVPMINISFE
jgi:hypothetical protein